VLIRDAHHVLTFTPVPLSGKRGQGRCLDGNTVLSLVPRGGDSLSV